MTLQTRESTAFDTDEIFVADIELDDSDILLAEEAETTKVEAISERIPDDRFGKNLDATQIYLNEIGFSPLLSAEEEVFFARKALNAHLIDLLNCYFWNKQSSAYCL